MNDKEQNILDFLISSNTVVPVKTIAKNLYLSEPTARRYIASLSKQGLIVRTHGGALANYNNMTNKSIPFYLRTSTNPKEKNEIAKKAAGLIKNGSTIFLDASSTAFHLLPYLNKFRDIIVCTNGLKTAISLAELNIKTICLGGYVNFSNLACNSQETFSMIENFNADLFFFSCDALDENGVISDKSSESSYLRSCFLKYAKKNVLLVDSSKLNKKCWHTLCNLSDIDYCFCDKELPAELLGKLKSKQNQ